MGRIGCWSDDNEIVVHHVEAPDPEALCHELLFRRPVMNEHHIGVTTPADIEGLPSTNGHHFDGDACLGVEARQ